MDFMYSIIVAIIGVFCLTVGIILSKANYKKRFQDSYSLLNHFPFEINYGTHGFENIFGNFFLAISVISCLLFYTTFQGSRGEGLGIFVFVAGIIGAFLNELLFYLSTKYLKTHIIALTLNTALTFMLISATLLLNLKYYRDSHNVMNLVGIIYSGVIALGVFILVINPKLSFKIKGKEVKDEKGETKLVRPSFIPVAFTEWMVLFAYFLNQLGIIFFLISIK